jgi:hypothetical protein
VSDESLKTPEALADHLAKKYPNGYVTEPEIGWPCEVAIRDIRNGLDTPIAFIYGSFMECRRFEIAFQKRVKANA